MNDSEAAVPPDREPSSHLRDRERARQLFVRRFRALQAETIEALRAHGMHDLTDEDVFRIVS